MLGIKRRTQMDKMKAAVREAVIYIDGIAGDERLRGDLRAAMDHGEQARDRIRKDFAADGIATQLANDRKLRKKRVRFEADCLGSARRENVEDGLRRRRSSARLRLDRVGPTRPSQFGSNEAL